MEKLPSIHFYNKTKRKLIIFVSLTLITSLIIFVFFPLIYFKSYIIQVISRKNTQLSNKIKEKNEVFFSSIINELSFLANSLANQKNHNYQKESLFDYYLNKLPDVSRLTLFDKAGKKILTGLKRSPDKIDDWSFQSEIKQNYNTLHENFTMSLVYPSYYVVPMIDVSIPIRNFSNNEIEGLIKAAISLRKLWRKNLIFNLGNEVTAYLIDENGKLIAHSQSELNFAVTDFSHIKKVRQFSTGIHKNDLKKPTIYYNDRNIKVIGTLIPIKEINWGIVIEEPVESALSSYYHLQKLLFVILAGLILLISISNFFFLSRFTQEIKSFNRQPDDFKEGNDVKNERHAKETIAHSVEKVNHLQKELGEKKKHQKGEYKNSEVVKDDLREIYNDPTTTDEKLVESLQKQIIEKANALILALNQEGKIIQFNKKCEEVTEYTKSEVMGKNWCQLMTPPEEKHLHFFEQEPFIKTSSSFEYPLITKKGMQRTISWHSVFFTVEEEHIKSIYIGEDVTEKKNHQKELETKNKVLKEENEELQNFVSIVTHDLKSPLYILQDFTSILLRDHKSQFREDALYYLERIKKNAENMERLIIDILEFSQIGATEDDYQIYPIIQIVERAVDELGPKIKEKNIHLTFAKNFPSTFCNPNRILQVFINLISNAIKFMNPEREGTIEIGCSEKNKENEFFVKDNGIGIEEEYREKIFTIFQRLKESKEVEGNGIGLAIVKKVVGKHGGKIWVHSQKGMGSTFYFTLPIPVKKKQNKKSFSPSMPILVD